MTLIANDTRSFRHQHVYNGREGRVEDSWLVKKGTIINHDIVPYTCFLQLMTFPPVTIPSQSVNVNPHEPETFFYVRQFGHKNVQLVKKTIYDNVMVVKDKSNRFFFITLAFIVKYSKENIRGWAYSRENTVYAFCVPLAIPFVTTGQRTSTYFCMF